MHTFTNPGAAAVRRHGVAILLVAAVLVAGWAAPPLQAAGPVAVTVMTRNMYFGAELEPIFGATDTASFAQATAAVLDQLNQSAIADRAARLADEIAATQPDLISLQEVALWRTGPLMAPPATEVLYDQLDLLAAALAKRKLHYGVVAIQSELDAEAPVPTAGLDLRFTDRDVVLARLDLPQSQFDLTNAQSHRYQSAFGFASPALGQFTLPRGWMSVDVTVRGVAFRFVATHLESTEPGLPQAQQAQEAQADELVAALSGAGLPIVIAGDFNSNAEPGPEQTGSFRKFIAAGFADSWPAVNPGDPGLTWPIFSGDMSAPAVLAERIDLVLTRAVKPQGFSHGLNVLSAGRTGTATDQWASDHAGLVVKLQLQ